MGTDLPKVRVAFVTGTRADFGKLKSLIAVMQLSERFEVHIFVTGMHLLSKYGYTAREVEACGFQNIHKFINQNLGDTMDVVLAKTVGGFSDFVKEICPRLIIIHGDRVEALAGALVGSLNNILVAHIEGGEVSGTIDESIRHAVTKLSHVHLVSNDRARERLLQLGEESSRIHVIGSPELDILASGGLPSLDEVKKRYEIPFGDYAVLMFHPVTTELDTLRRDFDEIVAALIEGGHNIVAIYPNNDVGSQDILAGLDSIKGFPNVRVFPSIRFEYFLALLAGADFVIGNSSAGVREAPVLGVPSVNVGTRQHRRAKASSIVDVPAKRAELLRAIERARCGPRTKFLEFGALGTTDKFMALLNGEAIWEIAPQKYFQDIERQWAQEN